MDVPGHCVKRGHADEPNLKRRCHALCRGHGYAHARERSRPPPADHAGDVVALDAVRGEQRVDAGKQLGVRCAMGCDFDGSHHLDGTGRRIGDPHAKGDDLVRRVESDHMARSSGFRAFLGAFPYARDI